jgi:DNA-binding transcriptional MerR regulator
VAATAKEADAPRTAPGRESRGAGPAADPVRTWSVRELADEFGVTTRTLRFYEAEGLLAPARTGTARSYGPRDHTRLVLILRGRRFGMSLPEIREIVDMYEDAATGERTQLLTLLDRLDEIAADLRARRRDLTHTLDEVLDVARQCRQRLADLPKERRRA